MSDIRLQAFPTCQNYRSGSCLLGGVHIRTHHNRATCALANKMARICYAVLRDREDYGAARVNRKLARETYALPA